MMLAVLAIAFAGGCMLPVPIGAPLPATTTGGPGQGRLLAETEIRAPNMLIGHAPMNASGQTTLGTTKWPDWSLGVARGVSRDVDVEAYIDGVMLPETIAAGVRWQLVDSRTNGLLDVAVAARGGGGTDLSLSILGGYHGLGNPDDGSFAFVAPSVVADLGGASHWHLRVAGEAIAAYIRGTLADQVRQAFGTSLLSTTIAIAYRLQRVEVAPYVAVGDITYSPIGRRSYVTGGLAFILAVGRR